MFERNVYGFGSVDTWTPRCKGVRILGYVSNCGFVKIKININNVCDTSCVARLCYLNC